MMSDLPRHLLVLGAEQVKVDWLVKGLAWAQAQVMDQIILFLSYMCFI